MLGENDKANVSNYEDTETQPARYLVSTWENLFTLFFFRFSFLLLRLTPFHSSWLWYKWSSFVFNNVLYIFILFTYVLYARSSRSIAIIRILFSFQNPRRKCHWRNWRKHVCESESTANFVSNWIVYQKRRFQS